jgi:transposase-like protein
MKTIVELTREAGGFEPTPEFLERLVELARADEREAIKDEWWMCVQSDLENGVKSLNEQAATKWRKEYPEIAKFGAWLNERGETK